MMFSYILQMYYYITYISYHNLRLTNIPSNIIFILKKLMFLLKKGGNVMN